MTNYRDKFQNNPTEKLSEIDTLNKSRVFNLNGSKVTISQTDNSYLTEAESERYVKAFIKQKSRYIPSIDYLNPSTFCFYGSAAKYYEDSIKNIYNAYPYDGSRAEKMEWSISASHLDLYMLEHVYPKSTGHVIFDRSSDTITNDTHYPTTNNPQYIKFTGGPQIGTIYNSSKNREGNLKINGSVGNTVEFWLKKSATSWYDAGRKEVIFDTTTPSAISGVQTGRLSIELENPSSAGASPFLFTYLSGTTGATQLRLGSSNVTKNSVGDNNWHHYAVTTETSGSNTLYKLYVDGTLDSVSKQSHMVGPVDRAMIASIGALRSANSVGGALGAGKLSGSIDEFRFWKETRSQKDIGRFWYHSVHGGTGGKYGDHNNANLGVYFKFNEGITNVQAYDEVVLDYSGRINNGTFVNWNSAVRSLESAINQSLYLPEKSFTEVPDPIINSQNTLVQNILDLYKTKGEAFDKQNNSSLINSVPSFLPNQDKNLFPELLQIMASSFDDIFLKIKNLPKIKDFAFQEFFENKGSFRKFDNSKFLLGCEDQILFQFTGNHTKPWVNHILEHFGLVTTEIFPNATLFENFLKRSEKVSFQHDLTEVKNSILSNIHKNLIHIYKTKGTEESFRNLIRCFGVDSELIKLYAYGHNEEYILSTKPIYVSAKTKAASFEKKNFEASIHQTASSSEEISYIPRVNNPVPYTLEANILFPNKIKEGVNNFSETSLFGMHSVKGSDANPGDSSLNWSVQDSGSLQVQFVKRTATAKGGYFQLTSSAGVITALTSDHLTNIYDNTHWNISVRIGAKSDIDFNIIPTGSSTTYLVEFSGYNYDLDVLKNSFHVSASISKELYRDISRQDKAVFVGSHLQNFSGSVLQRSDVRILSFNAWKDILKESELKEHAQNPKVFGRRKPQSISNFDDGSNLVSSDSLILRWQFENLTASNSSNQIDVVDFSSGSLALVSSDFVTGYKYPGKGIDFVDHDAAISQNFIPSVEYAGPDNGHSSDRVQVLTTDTQIFNTDNKPVTYFYNFEKSMYQTISSEMIKFFAGVVGYNNLIGEPVNKYRDRYKLMEKLREKFFARVENEINLEKFVEYYRWIDSALSSFLNQLIPASSNFGSGISDVIESHILERNKYRHKAPTIEFKDPADKIFPILSINELLYDWEHGHAPLIRDGNTNCLWEKDRAERSDTNREKIRKIVISEVSGSTYALRKLTKPYKFSVDSRKTISTGHNRKANKFLNAFTLVNQNKQITLASSNIIEQPVCKDIINPEEKETYRGATDVLGTTGYLDLDSDQIFPFTLVSSSVGTDFSIFKQNLTIANQHLPLSITGEASLRGPFAETHVGGMPHQKTEISQSNRPEAYAISADSSTLTMTQVPIANPKSMFFRHRSATSFSTISNIRHTTASFFLGNYSNNYEIVQTAGRFNNNRFFVDQEGSFVTDAPVASQYISGVIDYARPTRTRTTHIFVNKFGAPGGPESISDIGLDRASGEFSVYNSLNYRNPVVRDVVDILASEHTEQFGFRAEHTAEDEAKATATIEFVSGALPQNDAKFVITSAPSLSLDVEALSVTYTFKNSSPTASNQEFSGTNHQLAATNLANLITSVNGHLDRITVSNDHDGKITLTQHFPGAAGNVAIVSNANNVNISGFNSGKSILGSTHKTNRNPQRFTGSLGREFNRDNFFVQHPIPQSEYQYSWITASVNDSVYDFLNRNENMGYVHNFGIKTSKITDTFNDNTTSKAPSVFTTNQSDESKIITTTTFVTGVFGSDDSESGPTDNPEEFGKFVSSMKIRNNRAIVGNPNDDFTAFFGFKARGKVFTYVSGSPWSSMAILTSSQSYSMLGTSNSDKFGSSVQLSNNFAFVGAPENDAHGTTSAGAIYIYSASGGTWNNYQFITASTIAASGKFGQEYISATDDKMITIGKQRTDNLYGQVYVFDRTGSHWDETQVINLSSSQVRPTAASFNDTHLFVNGKDLTDEEGDTYRVYIYASSSGAGYSLNQTINSSARVIPACTNTHLAVAQGVDNLFDTTASVGVYTYNGSSWTIQQTVTGSDTVPGDGFVAPYQTDTGLPPSSPTIAISGNVLVVGSWIDDISLGPKNSTEAKNSNYGSVYLFGLHSDSIWRQERKLQFNNFTNFANAKSFGSSVDISSNYIAAGTSRAHLEISSDNQISHFAILSYVTSSTEQSRLDEGPIVKELSTDSTKKILALVGDKDVPMEVDQIPDIYKNSLDIEHRFVSRVINTKSEFVNISFDYIRGSSNSNDLSYKYGLTAAPRENDYLVVQYKIGSGNYQTLENIAGGAISGSTDQNNFSRKVYSIQNTEKDKITVRLVAGTSTTGTDANWGIDNFIHEKAAYSVKPSNQIGFTRDLRFDRTSTELDINCAELNVFNTQDIGSAGEGFQTLNTRQVQSPHLAFSGSDGTDDPFSVAAWIKPNIVDHSSVESSVSGSAIVTNEGNYSIHYDYQGKITFKLLGDTTQKKVNFISTVFYSDKTPFLAVQTANKVLSSGDWKMVTCTYDGSKDASGLSIYVNGVKQAVEVRKAGSYQGMIGVDNGTDAKLGAGLVNIGYHQYIHETNFGSGFPVDDTERYLSDFNIRSLLVHNEKLSQEKVTELYNLRNIKPFENNAKGVYIPFENFSSYSNVVAHWRFSNPTTITTGSQTYIAYVDKKNSIALLHATRTLRNASASNAPGFRFANAFGKSPEVSNKFAKFETERNLVNEISSSMSDTSDTFQYLGLTIGENSYPSWKQIRAGETPIGRYQKSKNIITISTRDTEVFPSPIVDYKYDINKDLANLPLESTRTSAREVSSFNEILTTNRFKPITITFHSEIPTERNIREEIDQKTQENLWIQDLTSLMSFSQNFSAKDSRIISIKSTLQNDLTSFSNKSLTDKLKINDYKHNKFSDPETGTFSRLSSIAGSFESVFGVEINYVETLYPKEVNTFTENARRRTLFDFFGWRTLRSDRSLILTGSNVYGNFITRFGDNIAFPEISIDKNNFKNTNSSFVDVVDFESKFKPLTYSYITSSRWPLDSRSDFTKKPLDISVSYFNKGDKFYNSKQSGRDGSGVFQNDYSIFGLGYNGVHGTPPVALIYNRRIPQVSGSSVYLSGESRWQAAEQSNYAPFGNSYLDHIDNLSPLAQDHSLVPEYKVSDFVEDIVNQSEGDYTKVSEKVNYLSVTGAVYHTSSQELLVGSKFFKTYGTTDFMKYFGLVSEMVEDNNIGSASRITLRCKAALKFTPYRGFYPAERVLQIGELFSRGYMPDFSFDDIRDTTPGSADLKQVSDPTKLLEKKIRANLQQTIKPFMAPGVLMNSIKSGIAVDYPIFGSDSNDTALNNFNTAIKQTTTSKTSFDSSLNNLTMFTGSIINSTHGIGGVPRLSGSVTRRITFDDLLDPQRVIGTKIYDNEPHQSASIYYGDGALTKVFDYPFTFGRLDDTNNKQKIFADDFVLKKSLNDTLTPYKMAINNFCAETVNFFLEGGKLSSFESDQVVSPFLSASANYKMRITFKNSNLKMYDRHSAFGPPVDEGAGLTKTRITGSLTTAPGAGSTADFGDTRPAGFLVVSSDLTGSTDAKLHGFTMTTPASNTVSVKVFKSGSYMPSSSAGEYLYISSGSEGFQTSSYDVSSFGDVYANGTSSYIDLASIESKQTGTAARGLAFNRLLEVAINHHRWHSGSKIEAGFVDGNNVRVRQILTGTAGDTTITQHGGTSSFGVASPMANYFSSFPSSFSSGINQATTLTNVTTSTITENDSHEYAPFVPPFLDKGSDPYVEINFTPDKSEEYTLSKIFDGAQYTYRNFKDTPSNHNVNTNFKEAMNLSASFDLSNFSVYKEDESQAGVTTLEQRKRWVIQTKWETPILNFINASSSALNLSSSTVDQVVGSPWQDRTWDRYLTKSVISTPTPYITSSTGMWHQYGSNLESDQEGYIISIDKVPGVSDNHQLARILGFIPESMEPVQIRPGKIAERKEISEAVVAIPFYYKSELIQGSSQAPKLFTMKESNLQAAIDLNSGKKRSFEEVVLGRSKDDPTSGYNIELEKYLKFYNTPGQAPEEVLAYQLRMMEKYVFPPQFDFLNYPEMLQKPMMYIFQFNAELTKQDLTNIWQNLAPQTARSAARARNSGIDTNIEKFGVREDVQYVSHLFNQRDIPVEEREQFLEKNVRWVIFKVKQRAEADLSKIKINSLPGSRRNLVVDPSVSSLKPSDYLVGKKYSFNWPYDYFSLVELIKLEAKVDFLPFG